MAKLADILADALRLAEVRQVSTISLPGGLTIVVDWRDPAAQQLRLGRRAPVWPSANEVAVIRRHIYIPPGAAVVRGQKGVWNVIAYTWSQPARQCG